MKKPSFRSKVSTRESKQNSLTFPEFPGVNQHNSLILGLFSHTNGQENIYGFNQCSIHKSPISLVDSKMSRARRAALK